MLRDAASFASLRLFLNLGVRSTPARGTGTGSASGTELAEDMKKAFLLAASCHQTGRAPEALASTYRDFQRRDPPFTTMEDELRTLQVCGKWI